VLKSVVDSIVFAKIRQATSGRLRFALSSDATLSRETQILALVTIVQGTVIVSLLSLGLKLSYGTTDMIQEMGSEYIVPYVMLSRESRKRNHALYKSILERSKKNVKQYMSNKQTRPGVTGGKQG